jgi:hypothetical protein
MMNKYAKSFASNHRFIYEDYTFHFFALLPDEAAAFQRLLCQTGQIRYHPDEIGH